MLKKLIALGLVIIVLFLGAYGYVTHQVANYISQPLKLESPQLFTVKQGTSLNRVLAQLESENLVEHQFYAKLLRFQYSDLTQIKAGTYQLTPGTNLLTALHIFTSGKEHQFAITFVEGSQFKEWRAALRNAQYLVHVTDDMSEEEIAKALGIKQPLLEGLFLAETYHYTQGASDLDILKRAHRKLEAILDKAWSSKQDDLPLKTPYEALILASIIEKETAVESERKRVASVFINRLKRRMRLQTDPTVIYGMGDDYNGNIRKKDLREPTPYNTYVINGLPPTPIAMPGSASIDAALNPEQSQYLYFVASGNGGHVFSKTLAEHNRAVRAYLKVLRSQR